jgi:hypothetical protein
MRSRDLILALLLCSCSPAGEQPPIVAPKPDEANCLSDRLICQAECVKKFAEDSRIKACQEDCKRTISCTNEAGVAAYVTGKDGGLDGSR